MSLAVITALSLLVAEDNEDIFTSIPLLTSYSSSHHHSITHCRLLTLHHSTSHSRPLSFYCSTTYSITNSPLILFHYYSCKLFSLIQTQHSLLFHFHYSLQFSPNLLFHLSRQTYHSLLSTSDPTLLISNYATTHSRCNFL